MRIKFNELLAPIFYWLATVTGQLLRGLVFSLLVPALILPAMADVNYPAVKSKLFHYSNPNYDPLWVTLTDDTPVVGPVLPRKDLDDPAGVQQASEEYVKLVFGLIVQAAHRYGVEVLESQDFADRRNVNGYWSLLLASLVVPYHESRLSHIRLEKGGRCVEKANAFQMANNHTDTVTETVQKILSQFYRDPINPLVAECEQVDKEEEVRQFIFNGTALGMWQTNARYHIDAVSPEVVLSLKNTIDYGVGFLFEGDQQPTSQGYFGILKNYPRYSKACSFISKSAVDSTTKKYEQNNIYFNLIRGLYGGQYYYGQSIVDAVCSFDPTHRSRLIKASNSSVQINDAWVEANKKFYQSLRDVVVGQVSGVPFKRGRVLNQNSVYQQVLPRDSVEWLVYQEILTNFEKIHKGSGGGLAEEPEYSKPLQALLEKDYLNEAEDRIFKLSQQTLQATHFTLANKTRLYLSPSVDERVYCGYLPNTRGFGVPLQVISEFDGARGPKSSGRWAQVRIPRHSGVIEFSDSKTLVALKSHRKEANIRLAPSTSDVDGVPTQSGFSLLKDSPDGISELPYLNEKRGPWLKVGLPMESINGIPKESVRLIQVHQEKAGSYLIGWVHDVNAKVRTVSEPTSNKLCFGYDQFFTDATHLEKIPTQFLADYLFLGEIDTENAPSSMKTWLRVRPTEKSRTSAIGVVRNGESVYVLGKTERSYAIWYPATPRCFLDLKAGNNLNNCLGWVDRNVVRKTQGGAEL